MLSPPTTRLVGRAPPHPVSSAPPLVHEDLADDRMALAMSGGGYRSMLFHVGVWRLNELGILVSDADAVVPPEPSPGHGWLRQTARGVDIQGAQVRDLRVRQLLSAFETPEADAGLWRRGAYWGASLET